MKRFLPEKKTLARFEFAAAILLTLVSLAFHLIFFLHAGPLWRDEISSLALATKPTLTEFWRCSRKKLGKFNCAVGIIDNDY